MNPLIVKKWLNVIINYFNFKKNAMRTRKNEKVDPDPTLPYLIFVGLVAKVFQDNLMSESMRPTVRIKKKINGQV